MKKEEIKIKVIRAERGGIVDYGIDGRVATDSDEQLARLVGLEILGSLGPDWSDIEITANVAEVQATGAPVWHPADEVPEQGRYIVRTHDGATFFMEPVGGKWPEKIAQWTETPT